jgi:2,3-diketo-5-methylthiopentyl-1-phosphate enolase
MMEMEGYVLATYLVHDQHGDFIQKAEKIAVGMTTGTWTDLPAVQQKKLAKHLGQVVNVEELEPTSEGLKRARLTIAFPEINFSADIPALLVTVFGKLSMDGKIRLVDIQFPTAFLSQFKGPKFGIEGVRAQLGVYDRPLLMSIFKSCIGQEVEQFEEQLYTQALSGVDLVKDDEILFENPLTPLEKRVEIGLRALEKAEQQTGQRVLYAVNLTGPVTELGERARKAVSLGAGALLFNVFAYGYDALYRLSQDPRVSVPIMAHPAMAGAMYPSAHYGIAAPVLLGKLLRLAGADLVLFPSPYGSVALNRDDALKLRDTLREPWIGVHELSSAFPVPSAGIHPGLTEKLVEDFGLDCVINAGGGIHGHPQGTIAGGRAFRQAIDHVLEGNKLADAGRDQAELKAALDKWGIAERGR